MINLFRSRPNLCYDAVSETLSTINNTSLTKSPSKSVQYPLSRMQRNKCMFVNQLIAEAMMEMVMNERCRVVRPTTDQCFQRQCSKATRTCPHAYVRHLCWGCRWLGSAHLFALASIFDCLVDVISCNICWMCNVIPCMSYLCVIGFGPVHNCSS